MSAISLDDLNQKLLSLELIDLSQLRDVENSFGTQMYTAEQFLQALQRYGYLTKYQVERLLNGETTGYYYGDYRIQYLIGAGSFARVFRCVHKETGKVVAVKVLRARFRDDQTAIDEFTREGEMGMELRHPNIAAVYESKVTKYDRYMVMEFIEGRTLREEVNVQKDKRVQPARATRITYDICSALDYAQKRGYQHRDMKLTNIMIASSGKAVLLDFGLLTDAKSAFKTQRAIEYAALERSTHTKRDDRRSDLYFLGAVYYQMLSGIAPLGEIKERSKRLDASRFKNIKPIREVAPFVPRSVAAVVDKSLKFQPEERFQTPEEMLRALDNAIKALERGDDAEEVVKTEIAKPKKPAMKTVMIVDGNRDMQDVFRDFLKKANFRALVISTTELALSRLEDVQVDAVLFNAQTLGTKAVDAFNQLLDVPLTRELPAILLLDENQVKWAAQAKRDKKRLAVGMPISLKRLLLVVDKLTQPEAPETPKEPQPQEKTEVEAENVQAAPSAAPQQAPQVASESVPASPQKKEESKENPEDDFPVEAFDLALDDVFDSFVANKATSKPGEVAAERAKREEAAANSKERPIDDNVDDDDYYLDDEEEDKD